MESKSQLSFPTAITSHLVRSKYIWLCTFVPVLFHHLKFHHWTRPNWRLSENGPASARRLCVSSLKVVRSSFEANKVGWKEIFSSVQLNELRKGCCFESDLSKGEMKTLMRTGSYPFLVVRRILFSLDDAN